jgi:hypothetical protein
MKPQEEITIYLIIILKLNNMATYYNTTNLSGDELKARIAKCKGQNEEFKALFDIYGALTKWGARRAYMEHFGPIDEIQPGRAIGGLCDEGHIYKSTIKVMEERGAKNFLFKLFPTDGSFPTDFDMSKLDKLHIPIVFKDGVIDEQATRDSFEIKLSKKIKEYNAE